MGIGNIARRVPGPRAAIVALVLAACGPAWAQPQVLGFSPSGGPPGTTVTIAGRGFDPVPQATEVAFGGAVASGVVVEPSGASLTAVVPGGASSGPITVRTGAGVASTGGLPQPTFEVSDVPIILALVPRSGVAGQTVRLLGRSLLNVESVAFTGGATVMPPFAVRVDATGSIVDALVPPGALSGPITLTTPGGTASTAALEPTPPDGSGDFLLDQPPVIDAFYPESGPPDAVVLLSGRNLFDATAVTLGGTTMAVVRVGDDGTSLAVRVPGGAASGLLAVATPHGSTDTSALSEPVFVVDALPRIDDVYPPSGDPGTLVTIFGANFGRKGFPPILPEENVVTHGGVSWVVEQVDESRTWVRARVAGGSTGTNPVRVTTPGGNATSPDPFTVSTLPMLETFQPTSGVPGARVIITGRSLSHVTGVSFGGVPALLVSLDPASNTVSAVVPEMAESGPIAVSAPGGTSSSADLVPPRLFTVLPATPCGNGRIDPGETCDDGNLAPGDCCTPLCRLEAMGAACDDDGNPCSDDTCDAAGSCQHPANTAPCDDGVFCNGTDTCDAGACQVHAGDPCAGGPECLDVCDEAAASCLAPAGHPCSADGDLCTPDVCDGGGACTHVVGPSPLCKQAVRAKAGVLKLRRRSTPDDDRLLWTLTHADATSKDELGDPLTATAYGLCIYDGSGALLVRADIPPGGSCAGKPCWRVKKKGARVAYTDPTRGSTGLVLVTVKAGKAGKVQATVQGKGALLGLPALPITSFPLSVQLHNEAGACWGATYTSAVKNLPDQLRAKPDPPARRAGRRGLPAGGPR